MKPTKTINRIHFEDLEPRRFEDLSLAMVYRMKRWQDIKHYGRSGSDDGIDIEATELLENNFLKSWFIQCKRYIKINKSDLKNIIDSIIDKNNVVPDVVLAIISCDVSKTNIEFFTVYALKKGINTAQIWSS